MKRISIFNSISLFLLLMTILSEPIFSKETLMAQSRYKDYYPALDRYYSTKPLGASIESGNTVFRLFAPTATAVTLVTFTSHQDSAGQEYPMKKDRDFVWEYQLDGERYGLYYGYRVDGPATKATMFDPSKVVADPYSRAVVTRNSYLHPAKSLIVRSDYDWENDSWMQTPIQDLVIYEMHVRDITIHASAGAECPGTYLGMIEQGKSGGIAYLLDLGGNAVELLPCQDFGNIEVPYNDKSAPVFNTWNPYERNHWGYMTSYFFAPESYYASNGAMKSGEYNGADGQQVNEFKDMVKALHRQGIAVIMDVVYNHVSQYDLNPFKYIDKKYYFRLNSKREFLSKSGCGNDFRTERPMARRLILDSITYWMTEYHIDGFRFDLAYLIDEETCRQILERARSINPNAYIIAEPWGDGYAPAEFSKLGWAAWNDKFRNGVKGQNPQNNQGFIFGRWEKENNPVTLASYVGGSIVSQGGLFQKAEHSINYLESHDDHTFGDFVRFGVKEVKPDHRITNLTEHIRLTEQQMKIHKLGALFLFVSQGGVMIHQGQEFARSKVIAPTARPDTNQYKIDHNSYNKDNETNWINYAHKALNQELYDYYRGLIRVRKKHPAFRKSAIDDIHFLKCANEFGLGFWIEKTRSGDSHDVLVLMNGHSTKEASFSLPEGSWAVIANGETAGTDILHENMAGEIVLPATTGMIFIQ